MKDFVLNDHSSHCQDTISLENERSETRHITYPSQFHTELLLDFLRVGVEQDALLADPLPQHVQLLLAAVPFPQIVLVRKGFLRVNLKQNLIFDLCRTANESLFLGSKLRLANDTPIPLVWRQSTIKMLIRCLLLAHSMRIV